MFTEEYPLAELLFFENILILVYVYKTLSNTVHEVKFFAEEVQNVHRGVSPGGTFYSPRRICCPIFTEEFQNIPRGEYDAKFSPRSTKFPPSLLGGKKFFTELLLTDCVRQGLSRNMMFW